MRMFLAPTLSEYAPVRAALADELAGGKIQLELCGMGQMCARSMCERLDRLGWSGGLMLIGWAGGLSPDLRAGDVVVADAVLNDRGERIPCTPASLPDARTGALLSVSAPLLTPQAKFAAQSSGALAVEMEAYRLAAWAQARHLPFIHARVILDTAAESLPDPGDALDPLGYVRPGQLAIKLLSHPKLAFELWRFARRMRKLASTLGTVALALSDLTPE